MTNVSTSGIELFDGVMEFNLCWIVGSLQEDISDAFEREDEQFVEWYSQATGKDVPWDAYQDTEYDSLGLAKSIAEEYTNILVTEYEELFGEDGPLSDLEVDTEGVSFSRDLFSGPDYVPAKVTVNAAAFMALLTRWGITELDDGRTPGSGFYRTLDESEWWVIEGIRSLFDAGLGGYEKPWHHLFEYMDNVLEFVSYPDALTEEAYAAEEIILR